MIMRTILSLIFLISSTASASDLLTGMILGSALTPSKRVVQNVVKDEFTTTTEQIKAELSYNTQESYSFSLEGLNEKGISSYVKNLGYPVTLKNHILTVDNSLNYQARIQRQKDAEASWQAAKPYVYAVLGLIILFAVVIPALIQSVQQTAYIMNSYPMKDLLDFQKKTLKKLIQEVKIK